MTDVFLKITGTQEIDGQSDTVTFSTHGTAEKSENGITLYYKEGELTGQKITNTKLSVDNNKAVLRRSGEINSELIIEKDKRNSCFYSSELGDILIGIYGQEVSYTKDENKQTVFLKYNIDSNLTAVSSNTVEIKIKEV